MVSAIVEIASIKIFGDDTTLVQNGTTTTGSGGNSGTTTGTGVSSTSTTTNGASALVTSYAPWSVLMLGLSVLFAI